MLRIHHGDTVERGERVSYDRVTVAVVVCVCLPRGAFLFDLGYRLLTNKSFMETAAFTTTLSYVRGGGGHILDPLLGFSDL